MTMGLIMRLYSNKVLNNPNLNSAQKIEKIKEAFGQSPSIRYDEASGLYYEANLDGFINEQLRKEYLEKTKGLAVNLGGRCGWTLLGVAAQIGELGVMKWLIEEQGANINLGNDFGHSPLLIAAENGQTDAMRYLISRGADINFATTSNCGDSNTGYTPKNVTPLHRAIRFGQIEAVRLLIENGALINKAGSIGSIQYGYFLLSIISDLEKGIEHPESGVFGDLPHRDKSKIPSQKNIQYILQLLEHSNKYQAFIKSSPTEEDNKAAHEFNLLIQATHKVIKKLQKRTPITTDCEVRILSFLYGDLEKHETASLRIENIVDHEDLGLDLADKTGKAGKKVVSI